MINIILVALVLIVILDRGTMLIEALNALAQTASSNAQKKIEEN